MRPTPTYKFSSLVTTVDPAQTQNQVGFVTKGDAQERQALVVFTPAAFRWPVVGEAWMMRYENGTPGLDGVLAPSTLGSIPPGDMVLNSPTGVVHVVGSADGSTDFVFNSSDIPTQNRATLVAGAVLVNNSKITANSNVILTAQDNNSTGALRVSARVPGASFTITSNNAGDHGVVSYLIFG